MDSKEKKDKGIAVAATIVVHALAVLVLVLMAFKTPTPLPAEEGVEVNLGSSDEGLGEIQPEKLESQKKSTTSPQTKQETSKSEEKNITDDNSENPPINEPKKTKTKTEPKEQPKKEENKYYKASNNPDPSNINDSEEKSSESEHDLTKLTTSEGNTKGSDDQGKINGSKDSKNHDGNGGKGTVNVGYNDKRGSKDLPKPSENFPEQGDVTIKIWINRNGSVTKAEIDRKYTNVINSTQREQARQAALRSTFVSDSNAPDPYVTSITYHYIEN